MSFKTAFKAGKKTFGKVAPFIDPVEAGIRITMHGINKATEYKKFKSALTSAYRHKRKAAVHRLRTTSGKLRKAQGKIKRYKSISKISEGRYFDLYAARAASIQKQKNIRKIYRNRVINANQTVRVVRARGIAGTLGGLGGGFVLGAAYKR